MNKSTLIKIGIGSLTATSVITPIAITFANKKQENNHIYFNDMQFNNEAEFSKWARENLDYRNLTPGADSVHSIYDGARNKYFDDSNSAYQHLINNYITPQQAYVSNNYTNKLGSLKRLPDNFGLTHDEKALINTYKGSNDSIHLNELDAYKSLLQVHNLYELDNMYFSNKSELDRYLLQKYDPDSTVGNIDGYAYSTDKNIWSNNLKSDNDVLFNNFVKNNAEIKIEFENGSYKTHEEFKNGINEKWAIDHFDSNASYTNVTSNNGKGMYIIDNEKDSPGDIIGPHIIESPMNPSEIANNPRENWKRTSVELEHSQNHATIDVSYLSSLSSMAMFSYNVATLTDLISIGNEETDIPNKIHNIFLNKEEVLNNDFHNFGDILSEYQLSNGKNLLEEFIYVETTLLGSKRTTLLQMVPLLRSWLIDKIILDGLPFWLIDYVNRAFDFAIRAIDHKLKEMLNPILSANAKKYNLSNVYNFRVDRNYQTHADAYTNNFIEGKIFVPYLYSSYNDGTSINADWLHDYVYASQAYITINGSVEMLIDDYNSKLRPSSVRPSSVPKLPESYSDISDNAKNGYEALYRALKMNKEKYMPPSMVTKYESYIGNFGKLTNKIVDDHIKTHGSWVKIDRNQFDTDFENAISEDWITIPNEIKEWSVNWLNTVKELHTFFESGKKLYDSIKAINEVVIQVWALKSGVLLSFTAGASVVPVIGAVVSILILAAEIIIGLIGKTQKDYYHYKHNNEEDFFWNGGSRKVHKFLGFSWDSGVVNAGSLKMIEPITIISPQTDTFKWFENNRYYNDSTLKVKWVNEIARRASLGVKQDGVVLTLTLKNQNNIEKEFASDDIDELIIKIKNDSSIKDWRINYYATSNGLVDDPNALIKDLIDSILRNIKPLWVAQLPVLTENGYKLENYRIPTTKDKPLYGVGESELESELTYDYYILNYNFVDPDIIHDLPLENATDVTNYFINRFKNIENNNVEQKNVLIHDLISNVYFSKLPEEYSLWNVYKARLKNGEEVVFTDLAAALKWVAGNMKLEIQEIDSEEAIWAYEDYEFKSITDFIEWVKQGGNNV